MTAMTDAEPENPGESLFDELNKATEEVPFVLRLQKCKTNWLLHRFAPGLDSGRAQPTVVFKFTD